MQTAARVDERSDNTEKKLDNVPTIIREEIADAVDKITLQINTKKIQAITPEEITRQRKDDTE